MKTSARLARAGRISAPAALVCALCLAACEGEEAPPLEGARLNVIRMWTTAVGADERVLVSPAGELPADTLSVTLVARSAPTARIVFDVRDLSGRLLVDPAAPEWSENRALPGQGLAVVMLPSSTKAVPLSGNYQVVAATPEAVRTTPPPAVTAFVKRPATDGGPMPRGQELPLSVAIVGQTQVDEGRLRQALGRVSEIWRSGGVVVRAAAPVRLEGPDYIRFERLQLDPQLGSDTPALGELLELSARVPAAAPLTVFLTGDVSIASGAPVWAVSGGVPIPPAPGTKRSGVVVNAEVVAQDPDRAGQVIAHEIGHALGLYHTTEGSFLRRGDLVMSVHDQLDDTPACPMTNDRSPADGTLSPAECAAQDASNLMFWAAGKSSVRLTREQGEIARRSAITR